MKRISSWISIVALLLSILSLACRNSQIPVNSIIIASFSILTTILIGWQIYNIINFNQEKKEFNEQINNFYQENEKLSNSIDSIRIQIEETNENIEELENSSRLVIEIKKIVSDCGDLKWKNIKSTFDKLDDYKILDNKLVDKEILSWLEGISPVFRDISEKNVEEINSFILFFSPSALNTKYQKESALSIISIYYSLIYNSIVRAKNYNAAKKLMDYFEIIYNRIISTDQNLVENADVFKRLTYSKNSDSENFKKLISEFLENIGKN